MRRIAAVFTVFLLVLIPYGQVLGWNDDGADRGPQPMADGTPWSDSLDDLSNVYTQPGGVVGVEVSGGDAHLMAGHDVGRITSAAITCPVGYRYDLVLLDAVLPGNSSVNISILDPSTPSTLYGFVNEPVPGFINMTGTDESVFRIGTTKYPKIQIQVNLIANGTDRPRLLAWSLYFIPVGQWSDDLLGTGKMTSFGGINLTGSAAELDLSDKGGGGGSYDPYPPVLFPDGSGDVDVFYPKAGNNGYQNGDTIANTATSRGIDSGDLDDDGYIDIVLTAGGNQNSMILWGSSTGKWSTSDKTDLVHLDPGMDAAIGDFNGDGAMDVVIAALGLLMGDGSYVYLNNGDGTFDRDPDIKLGDGSTAVDAGDLDNDGYDDIVLTVALGGGADCYLGDSNGPDTTADISFLKGGTAAVTPQEVLVQDVDQDGYLDLLFAVLVYTEAPVYIGSASGPDTTIDYKLTLKSSPMDVSAGDINNDGYIDIAYSTVDNTGAGSNIEIYKGTSTGWNTNNKYAIAAGNGLHPVEVVDIDVDGYDDIVTGEAASLKLYMGGATWPTLTDLTLAGLTNPQDVTVSVPSGGGGGGTFRGSFLTDPIPPPQTEMKWDILHLDGTVPANTSVTITVLDSSQDPIPGYEQLSDLDVDLSGISNLQEIYVQVDLWSETNDTTPVIRSLLINWMDRMAWRDQFFGNVKTESALELGSVDLQLKADKTSSDALDLLFTSLRNNVGYDTKSKGFIDSGSLDYSSTALRGSPAGWYDTPFHTIDTVGASDVALEAINDDGYTDVVFAQERDWQGPDVNSILFWGSAAGWNSTPDIELETAGAVDLEVVDWDGDGRLDLVFACFDEGSPMATSMIFDQEDNGTYDTEPSGTFGIRGARAVASGDLNKDGAMDLVFATPLMVGSYDSECYLFYGRPGGGIQPPVSLPTLGAFDVKIADLNSDTYLDIVFANYRNASAGYESQSYIYLNDGSGGFGTSPDVMLPTEGAYAVEVTDLDGVGFKDLVFACLNNGTGFGVPSVAFLGGPTGWSLTPDLVFPTTGATDVLSLSLSGPDLGGYLSKPITPDAVDDIGAFHTLTYDAGIDPSKSGTIAIVDTVTGEMLAETDIEPGSKAWDLREAISYRDHPSIRVLIVIEGLDSALPFTLDDLWLNWTVRVMKVPVVVDMDLVNNTVLRTETIKLWVNVTDEYDRPEDLVVLIEHQLEGDTLWKTTMLGSLTFVDGIWWRDVTPDRYEALGVYSFRVNVTDTDRESSGYVGFPGTLEVLPNLPTEPRMLQATAGDGVVSLEWRAPLDMGDLPISGYMLYRGLSEDGLSIDQTLDPFTLDLDDTTVANGITYYYAIQALSDVGDGPMSAIVNATPLGIPGMPPSFEAEAGNGEVALSWYAPVLDGGTEILGYNVFRGLEPGIFDWLSEVNGTTFTDSSVTNGVTYHYMVIARNIVGDGPSSEVLSATPIGLPSSPDDLAASSGLGEVQLIWQVPGDTGGGDILMYIIYRGDDPDDLEPLIEVGIGSTNYYDSDVTAGTTYHYRISAASAAGEGAMSLSVSATPYGPSGPPIDLVVLEGDGKVTLTWATPEDDGAAIITGYVVSRGLTPGNLEDIASLGLVLEYMDSSANNGITYYYSVSAINVAGIGTAADAMEATPFKPAVVPGRISILNAEPKGAKVILVWTAPSEDGGSPITGYIIMRGESPDDLQVLDTRGPILSYTDDDVKKGRTYHYAIVPVNAVGEGELSIVQKVDVAEAESEDGGPMLWIALAIVAVVVVILALLLVQRGKGTGTGPDEVMPQDEVSEEGPIDEELQKELGTEEEEPRPEIVIEHIEVR